MTLSTTALLAGIASPAQAAPYWNKRVKCSATDYDGRVIETRIGNHDLGWNHFSGKHNVKKCDFINKIVYGKPDEKKGARLVYYGQAINSGRVVNTRVIVQYARKTKDEKYDAGRGEKIGVITAFCKGMNKCPNWVNQ